MKIVIPAIFALTLSVQPLADSEFLEPSIQNEVDHAISIAPVDSPEPNLPEQLAKDTFGTNTLDKTSIAIKLVSTQSKDGRWRIGTNDVTHIAVKILESL